LGQRSSKNIVVLRTSPKKNQRQKEVRICETLEWMKTGWISIIDHGDAIAHTLVSELGKGHYMAH
jgi:hypothetical protein